MRRMIFVVVTLLLVQSSAMAQEARNPVRETYESPRQESAARREIHRRAAWKATQRQQRLESYKWMGYSPLRPPISQMQFMGPDNYIAVGYLYHNLPGMILPAPAMLPR